MVAPRREIVWPDQSRAKGRWRRDSKSRMGGSPDRPSVLSGPDEAFEQTLKQEETHRKKQGRDHGDRRLGLPRPAGRLLEDLALGDQAEDHLVDGVHISKLQPRGSAGGLRGGG